MSFQNFAREPFKVLMLTSLACESIQTHDIQRQQVHNDLYRALCKDQARSVFTARPCMAAGTRCLINTAARRLTDASIKYPELLLEASFGAEIVQE
jgi:hypothetical protein